MTITAEREPLILFLGDIAIFFVSLWITLIIRYFELPEETVFYNHLVPFSLLFVVWVLVFFIAGLYGKHTILFKRRLPSIILRAQLTNVLIAAAFFFFVDYFGIEPKTNLIIYLGVSFLLIVVWRLFLFPHVDMKKRRKVLFIGSGSEIKDLENEMNNNTRYGVSVVETIDVSAHSSDVIVSETERVIKEYDISTIALDATDERIVPVLPTLYSLIFLGIDIVDVSKMYENIFERVPLSFVKQNWLIDNVSLSRKFLYDVTKRIFDFCVALCAGLVSLVLYPFVCCAIMLDDGGSFFYYQTRVGEKGKTIRLMKFRSMSEEGGENITRLGKFLRKTRMDELPQLWSVVAGDLSLIGPRPEIPDHVALYEHRIPYYNVRHLIKPGLSGWAQIHQDKPPKYGVQYDETTLKLSYDLFYIKHRSAMLDLQIALQTIKTLFSRSGL